MVGFGLGLLFFFVPETFWDRTPRPKSRRPTSHRSFSNMFHHPLQPSRTHASLSEPLDPATEAAIDKVMTPRQHMLHEQNARARFHDAISDEDKELKAEESEAVTEKDAKPEIAAHLTDGADDEKNLNPPDQGPSPGEELLTPPPRAHVARKKVKPTGLSIPPPLHAGNSSSPWDGTIDGKPAKTAASFMPPGSKIPNGGSSQTFPTDTDLSLPHLHNLNSPYYVELEKSDDYLSHHSTPRPCSPLPTTPNAKLSRVNTASTMHSSADRPLSPHDLERSRSSEKEAKFPPRLVRYTTNLRQSPPKSYHETLRPWNGRLSRSNWFLVALRPFILFAYPSVLWSTLVYSLSVGWLIVLSESISDIYRSREGYNFSALGAGLIYLSPFIGGILGTAVAGKVSDIIVRFMARRNGGVYEPEFRLVMATPVAFTTAIGLMGFGWSAEERDAWIVPTIFFGVISFGCSLGSTTAITFCVDSYRQYAGEALVTLNFSKNIFHGLVFSLFFASWLQDDGPKATFLTIGGIQIACMLSTIPMYIYGKRARMWTVRKGFMEKF